MILLKKPLKKNRVYSLAPVGYEHILVTINNRHNLCVREVTTVYAYLQIEGLVVFVSKYKDKFVISDYYTGAEIRECTYYLEDVNDLVSYLIREKDGKNKIRALGEQVRCLRVEPKIDYVNLQLWGLI